MLLALLVALLLGCIIGTFTGLFPGIHINLVAAGLLASIGFLGGVEPIILVVFIVAMAVTHTFLDFIPSIFLGAPDEDSFLAVLPGHQLLKQGKGYEAVVLTLYGSLVALPIILLFSFLFIWFLPTVFEFSQKIIPYILIFVSLYLIFREEEFFISLSVFLFAGFLGFFSFNLPVKEPLLPLLSGLFGVSSLVVSTGKGVKIPNQKIKSLKKISLELKSFLKYSFAAAVAAPLCSFLPGIGSGHAAVIGSELAGNAGKDERGFLFLVGAINTIVMGLSFVSIYAIGRARTGAAAAVNEIIGEIVFSNLVLIIGIVIVSGLIAFFIGIKLSGIFSRNIVKVSYWKLSYSVIFVLVAVNLFLSNFLGLIVLLTGSALGVFAILSGVRRINLMGALLLPTIVFYLVG